MVDMRKNVEILTQDLEYCIKAFENDQFDLMLEDLSYNVRVVDKELKEDNRLNLLKPTRKMQVLDEFLKYYIKRRVIIYKGTVEFMERKTSRYGDKYTEYFIIKLKDVLLGPKLEEADKQTSLTRFFSTEGQDTIMQKKSMTNLVIRLSDKTFYPLNLNIGNVVRLSGTIKENRRYGYLVVRVLEPNIIKKAS